MAGAACFGVHPTRMVGELMAMGAVLATCLPAIAQQGAPEMSRRLAVIVGVNGYTERPLPHAVSDATRLSHVLNRLCGYRAENVSLLTDALKDEDQPTKHNILTALRTVAGMAGRQDTILFFFSGHGTVIGTEGYLAPIDFRSGTGASGLLSIDEVRKTLKASKASHCVMLLDSCYSGSEKGIDQDAKMSPAFEKTLQANKEALVVMTSCRANEVSYSVGWVDGGRGGGLFSHYLVQGLSGAADQRPYGNDDYEVEVGELYNYVMGKVGAEIIRMAVATPQTPCLMASMSGRVVLARVTPAAAGAAGMLTDRDVVKILRKLYLDDSLSLETLRLAEVIFQADPRDLGEGGLRAKDFFQDTARGTYPLSKLDKLVDLAMTRDEQAKFADTIRERARAREVEEEKHRKEALVNATEERRKEGLREILGSWKVATAGRSETFRDDICIIALGTDGRISVTVAYQYWQNQRLPYAWEKKTYRFTGSYDPDAGTMYSDEKLPNGKQPQAVLRMKPGGREGTLEWLDQVSALHR